MAEEPTEQDYVLIFQQPGKAEQTLAKFVKLLLSQYGLNTKIVSDFTKVRSVLRQGADRMRCSFVIQSKSVSARSTVPVLTDKGRIPIFLVLPGYVANEQKEECEEMENVFISPWEMSFTTGPGSLQSIISMALKQEEDAFGEGESDEFEDRVRKRLDNLDTLPAIVTHIMRLVNDPKTTMAELEELLSSDPLIVLCVVQIANSAVFAGATGNRRWSLNEAIVRLGLRKANMSKLSGAGHRPASCDQRNPRDAGFHHPRRQRTGEATRSRLFRKRAQRLHPPCPGLPENRPARLAPAQGRTRAHRPIRSEGTREGMHELTTHQPTMQKRNRRGEG